MGINKRTVFQLISIVVLIVLLLPLYYLVRYVDNLFGAVAYFFVYMVFFYVLRYFMFKPAKLLPRSMYRNTLTTKGRIQVAVGFGFLFAIIIALVAREFTGLWVAIGLSRTGAAVSDPYFWLLFVVLFVVGAIIGDTIRKASQSTRIAF